MLVFLIALAAAATFVVAYRVYGSWIANKVFAVDAKAPVPSESLRDDVDYVPTAAPVIFGHHFTSIAGTGPIVGPAIGIFWGWAPALLWVIFGSIFIGAVHDFGSLMVSLRNRGQTVGELSGRLLNPRVRMLFLVVLFVALTIVLAIFGLVIAAVFKQYPAAILPCLLQIPIAVLIGLLIHRKQGKLLLPSLLALGLMYVAVLAGNSGWLGELNAALAALPIATWVVILLIYSYVASVLPVWVLLQPRDYINSLQLLSALGLVVLGLVGAAFLGGAPDPQGLRPPLELAAPAWNPNPAGAPAMFPFLFVTIACGAISGFHCLVSSGTSSKQLQSECDAKMIGYGSMLTEGFLAVLVILAIAAGLGLGVKTEAGQLFGEAAWLSRYGGAWGDLGLGAKVAAFVDGAANLLAAIGIPRGASIALMGVLVASFAGTTLDSACRLQRYIVQELAGLPRAPALRSLSAPLRNKHGATLFAVLLALIIAMLPPAGQAFDWQSAGKGGLLLWPLFGATNQLLGGLAFLVITFYLWRRGKPVLFVMIPMLLMLCIPFWAMFQQVFVGEHSWVAQKNGLLAALGSLSLLLELWMVVEAMLLLPRSRGVLEPDAVEAL